MERKVRIVRFWLLMALVAALVVVWPSVGIACWPLLGMMIATGRCCCGGNTCHNCDPANSAPDQIQIVIAGVANKSPVLCATCADFNATFILDLVVGPDCIGTTWPTPKGACGYDVDPEICDRDCMRLTFSESLAGGAYHETVATFGDGGFGCPPDKNTETFSTSGAARPTKIDCSSLSSYNIPILIDGVTETFWCCEMTSATLAATSL